MVSQPVAFLVLLLSLLPAAPARAVFTAAEMDVVDAEPLFDSEYFLDLLAFSPPVEWDWSWDAALSTRPAAAYRLNGASLDCCSLLLQQEASLRRRLADWLDFRYDLRQSDDKDAQDFHQWLALEAGPWRGVRAGVFGEPTSAKQDSDIGALLRGTRPGLTGYGLVDAVDWNFNRRNFGGARYERVPYTWELGASISTAGGVLRPRVEIDVPLRRAEPARSLLYHYRRTTAVLRWDKPLSRAKPGFAVIYRHEMKQEGNLFVGPAAGASLDHARVVDWLRAAAVLPAGERASVEAGAEALWRRARSASPGTAPSMRYLRWELHPYARWRKRLSAWAVGEVAGFLSVGESRQYRLDGASLYSRPVEAKVGLGLDFLFSRDGRIGLYSNFDADDAARHVWDGGNIRAQLFF